MRSKKLTIRWHGLVLIRQALKIHLETLKMYDTDRVKNCEWLIGKIQDLIEGGGAFTGAEIKTIDL